MMNIFELVKKEADTRKLTIQEVEKLAGISNGSISKWDKSVPKADRLQKVAAILELPMEFFLTDGAHVPNYLMDRSERELLHNFRLLDNQEQHQMQLLIYAAIGRTQHTEPLAPIPFAASGWANMSPEAEDIVQQHLQQFEQKNMELNQINAAKDAAVLELLKKGLSTKEP